MTRGQLAILPMGDGRRSERRILNLAARLREAGAALAEAEVLNLSVDGFMARTDARLDKDMSVWLKLPGLEPQGCRVVWIEEGKAGFEFATPLHPATLELIVATARKTPPKRHFGPQGLG